MWPRSPLQRAFSAVPSESSQSGRPGGRVAVVTTQDISQLVWTPTGTSGPSSGCRAAEERDEIGPFHVINLWPIAEEQGRVCNAGAAMGGRNRVISAIVGVVMIVGGFLVFDGHRAGWLLGVAGAAAGAFIISNSVGPGKRSD